MSIPVAKPLFESVRAWQCSQRLIQIQTSGFGLGLNFVMLHMRPPAAWSATVQRPPGTRIQQQTTIISPCSRSRYAGQSRLTTEDIAHVLSEASILFWSSRTSHSMLFGVETEKWQTRYECPRQALPRMRPLRLFVAVNNCCRWRMLPFVDRDFAS